MKTQLQSKYAWKSSREPLGSAVSAQLCHPPKCVQGPPNGDLQKKLC